MSGVDELAQAYALPEGPPPPAFPSEDCGYPEWRPNFGPKQLEFYESTSRYCLATGERWSGKTWTALHKLVNNCWNGWNAHALIVVSVRRQATTGGAWHKLMTEVLPEWEANQQGFWCSEQKQDSASKDLMVWLKNKWGGYSQIQLVSIPYGASLAERSRGLEVSSILVDELTMMDDPGYFTVLSQQLGRRPHIPTERQQYIAAANPTGPSSWVYKTFIETAKKEDGSPDTRYHVVHVPIGDNPDPRAQAYYENIKEATKHDPIEFQRLVLGLWIDRPSGTAIFRDHFFPNIHVKGDLAKNLLLVPKIRTPITIGWDPGDCNHGVVFMQERPVADRRLWIVFDEIAITGQNVSLDELVPAVMAKMNYWCATTQHDFTFQHISDKSAFNRFRSASGSYDHLQVERISRELLETQPTVYPRLKKAIRFTACPKPPGSVAGRIKTLMALLAREEIFLSAKCVNLIKALEQIESEKDEPFSPSRNGGHIHVYDALTYPLFFHALGKPPPMPDSAVALPGIIQLGGRN